MTTFMTGILPTLLILCNFQGFNAVESRVRNCKGRVESFKDGSLLRPNFKFGEGTYILYQIRALTSDNTEESENSSEIKRMRSAYLALFRFLLAPRRAYFFLDALLA